MRDCLCACVRCSLEFQNYGYCHACADQFAPPPPTTTTSSPQLISCIQSGTFVSDARCIRGRFNCQGDARLLIAYFFLIDVCDEDTSIATLIDLLKKIYKFSQKTRSWTQSKFITKQSVCRSDRKQQVSYFSSSVLLHKGASMLLRRAAAKIYSALKLSACIFQSGGIRLWEMA